MPEFKKYPTATENPNRKQRKAQRKSIFAFNQAAYAEARRARRAARKAAAEKADTNSAQ